MSTYKNFSSLNYPQCLPHSDEFGDMRKGTKLILLHKLATFASTPLSPVDVQLVDGNEALYPMAKIWDTWPLCRNVLSFIPWTT